jgi:hypothetical protein
MDVGLDGASDDAFFARLPEVTRFAECADPRCYQEAPRSWLVVVTDVRGSTRAIEAGRYRDVNALGVASIVGLCNAMPEIDLPYVFGGDGATLLAPGSCLPKVQRTLRGVKQLAREAFDLELRAGVVPLAQLAAEGHVARVARFRASEHARFAMFAGSAFSAAERWIKDPARGPAFEVVEGELAEASFEGFECRWQPIESRRGVIASVLISALAQSEAQRAAIYGELLDAIERIVGTERARPVTREGLRFAGVFDGYSTEARVRSRTRSGPSFEAAKKLARKKTFIGRALALLGKTAGGFDPARYAAELVENTDFRKFDETLRMVLDLSSEELAKLKAYLMRERAAKRIAFGIHEAPAALMTCLVRSYAGNHMHFVDGAGGGYALAAKQMKTQLAEG